MDSQRNAAAKLNRSSVASVQQQFTLEANPNRGTQITTDGDCGNRSCLIHIRVGVKYLFNSGGRGVGAAGCRTPCFLKGGIPRLSPAWDFLLTPAARSFIECADDPHHPPLRLRSGQALFAKCAKRMGQTTVPGSIDPR